MRKDASIAEKARRLVGVTLLTEQLSRAGTPLETKHYHIVDVTS